ncbi:uracil phosphoribosyltransferase-domain-containing protein [Kickxella alabastrina]|uniref:uracil phosphoribosyltransferase-domain-containing protein n=1 Tax=Kickxella alabastrina TaxID=61397 RepID=UPI00221EADED|nr:uracil phosphoribosyltransferase-domain-containing protein [Kickxella alabastrina]KAI7833856.1 uracil phosphoribosyltransferase-domain-containing protein [Kickxella alabastrina]
MSATANNSDNSASASGTSKVTSTLMLKNDGRPPWYTADGKNLPVYMVGIAGGSASGKTSVAKRIVESLDVPWVVIISMDSFYRRLAPEESKQAFAKTTTWTTRPALTIVPQYDFATHAPRDKSQNIYGASVVIFEGIFALYDPEILKMMDVKIFVDTDSDICLARRIKRDVADRGRDPLGVLQQYDRFVKPAYDSFVRPTMNNADVIIPRGLDNQRQLDGSNATIMRPILVDQYSAADQLKDTLLTLPQSNQTILCDRTTSRDDFIFYSDRLSRLIIEHGLGQLRLESKTVVTPMGLPYSGFKIASDITGVTVLRAGGVMEKALRSVARLAHYGKILIVGDPVTHEPRLHYAKLPPSIKDHQVLLMDPTIVSGANALMAIRICLDHENIVFVSLLATPQGVHAIQTAFPTVKIVVALIDSHIGTDDLLIESEKRFVLT